MATYLQDDPVLLAPSCNTVLASPCDKMCSQSLYYYGARISTGTGTNAPLQQRSERNVSDQSHDEYLVLQFQIQHDVLLLTYCLLIMSVFAIPAEDLESARKLYASDEILTVYVPHRHGQTRSVRLRSNCIQRVCRQELDSIWNIDPSWSYIPLEFESPVDTLHGCGSIEVIVDRVCYARAAFDQRAASVWSEEYSKEFFQTQDKPCAVYTMLDTLCRKSRTGNAYSTPLDSITTSYSTPLDSTSTLSVVIDQDSNMLRSILNNFSSTRDSADAICNDQDVANLLYCFMESFDGRNNRSY